MSSNSYNRTIEELKHSRKAAFDLEKKSYNRTIGELKHRAAFAIPGIWIFIHTKDAKIISLIRHEFGHILQSKKWGKLFFYRFIATESIISVRRSNKDSSFHHQHTWTEWTGFDPEDDNNIASYEYPTPRTYTFGIQVGFQ